MMPSVFESRIGIRCLTLLFLMPGPAFARHPDFTGVWQATPKSAPLLPTSGPIPFDDRGAALYNAIQARTKVGDRSWDTLNQCIPPGTPRAMAQPYPFEIIQEPTRVSLLFQLQRLDRSISLTGHSNMSSDPTFMGDSLGHWEGNTLVIESANFKTTPDTFLNDSGAPHSDQLKVTERWSSVNPDTLKDEIKIEDPKFLTRPWHTVLVLRRLKHVAIAEDVCVDRVRAKH